jgi:hypothetical protein
MKLRIQGNSIRFRVTQGEVATLAAGGKLESWIEFAPLATAKLGYTVAVSSEFAEMNASCSNGVILVNLPANLVRTWASTDQVGIEHVQPTSDGGVLRIVVEKDFRCRHTRASEDEDDNFPHPGDRLKA